MLSKVLCRISLYSFVKPSRLILHLLNSNYSERVQGSTPNTWPNLAEIGPITVVDTHTCADTETYAKDSTDDKL